MNRAAPSFAGIVVSVSSIMAPATAQTCTPQWWNANQGLVPQFSTALVPHVFAEFDQDGSGPLPRHLYTAGFFTFDDGMVLTPGIARWDGFQWTSVAQGLGAGGINIVLALAEYDRDGAGPLLPSLIAGGLFGNAGSVQVKSIAQWDGTAWSAMGTAFPATAQVRALASHDPDGTGPNSPYLVVAGAFSALADGTPCESIARWNGSQWFADMQRPTGVQTCVALRSFDLDGPGGFAPILFGWMISSTNDSYGIFRWTGTHWGFTGLALTPTRGIFYDTASPSVFWDSDGVGPGSATLYVADPNGLYRWVGGGWVAVSNSAGGGSILAEVDDDGTGPRPPSLYSVTQDQRIVRWSGSQWITVGTGQGGAGLSGAPYAMIGFDIDGTGPRPGSLFVGGELRAVSGVTAYGVARYGCEESWQPCIGDANRDLVVNFDDLTEVLTFWGASAGNGAFADVNNDDVVGFTDITAVLTSFGQDCSGALREERSLAVEPGPATPLGRAARMLSEEGFAGVTRALANWPSAE